MSDSRSKKHCFWSSLVAATFVGCSLVLYFSYVHEEHVRESFENRDDAMKAEKQVQAKCPKVCFTKECVNTANILLENMDQSADPCEDFYSFSCGSFIDKFSPSDNYSTIEDMSKRLKLKLKYILDNLKESQSSSSTKLKTMYDSCTNEKSSDKDAIRSILRQFGISNWPHLPSNFSFASSFERTVGKMAAANEFSFVKFKITGREVRRVNRTGLFNLTIHDISPLMRSEAVSGVYKNMVLRILNYFDMDEGPAHEIWEEFLKLDGDLLQLYVAYTDTWEEEETQQYVRCDNETMETETSICAILKHFIETADLHDNFSMSHAYMKEVQFLEHLFPTLRNYTQTSLANYLSLRFVLEHLEELDIIFRLTMLTNPEVYSLETDYRVAMDRWEICVEWISKHIPYTLGTEYIKEFSKSQLEEMHEITQTYFEEAGAYITNINWIHEHHKEQIKTKTKSIDSNLEYYINVLLNGSNFNSEFEGFEPAKESFLQNVVKYRKHVLMFFFQNFRAKARLRFPSDLFAVNAYHFDGNLVLAFGLFLPPVYQHGRPKLLNLISLGPVIGHEIGHEIESQLGDYSVLYNETRKKYQEKRDCLEDQFFGYDVRKIGRKARGNYTLHENLADLIGMEITQQVIEKYIEDRKEDYEFSLPTLNYTTQQLLYVHASQLWCSVRSRGKEQLHHEQNTHSSPDIRITSMLRNLVEFSHAFSCASQTDMNQSQRCSFRD